jgi:hypothetical protein
MPFSKSKPGGGGALEKLNDQRHRIALGAVAAGAAVAAVFRRKRRGGEAEFAVSGAEAPRSEAPAASAVDTAAEVEDEPKAPAAPRIVTPPTSTKRPANSAPAGAASSSIAEPTTGELSAEEASILSVLAQSGRKDDDRTAIAVATSLERETADVTATLRKLGSEGVVSGEQETPDGDKIWAVTERGVRRLGAQH